MPPTKLLAAALILPLPLFLVQQHLHLLALYPTQPVTPLLEIARRKDQPNTGMGKDPSNWIPPSAGDQWTAVIPREWLVKGGCETDGKLVNAFATAFWNTWPLRLELKLMQAMIGLGVGPFEFRGAKDSMSSLGAVEDAPFCPGALLVGGLFQVEACDIHPPSGELSAMEGPIVAAWWLKAIEQPLSPRSVLGGYHSLAVEPLMLTSPSAAAVPDHDALPPRDQVRLLFTSHLVVSPSSPTFLPNSPPTSELEGLGLQQRLLMHFHQIYGRILLDLAVRTLRREHSS